MKAAVPGAVRSPCVNVCRMSAATGLCEGCLRTIDEIAAWGQLSDAARLQVWQQLHQRRALARQARRAAGGNGESAP